MKRTRTLRTAILGRLFAALILIAAPAAILTAPTTAIAASQIFGATALTGGTAGCLDYIDGATLVDKDMAIVIYSGNLYTYALNATSGATESSPDVISPDSNAGTKRWILQGIKAATATDQALTASKPVFTDANKALTSSGTMPLNQGGTGQTTKSAAFDALSPMDGIGQVIYGGTSGTGTKLAAGLDGQVLVSNGAAAPGWEYQPKINLLSNTEWKVMSGSTLENVGSAIFADDCADDGTADWSAVVGSLAFDTDHYEITHVAADAYVGNNTAFTALVVGKLYKASVAVKDGTAASQTLILQTNAVAWGQVEYSPTITTTAGWVTHTWTFEASSATAVRTSIKVTSNLGGNNIEFKNFTLYEVTPGYTTATGTNVAPDGWYKDTTLGVYREHNGTNTKAGSFYSLKSSPSAQNDFFLWPTNYTESTHLQRFAGKTITFGMWIKSSTASDIRLFMDDGTSYMSSPHTGGGDWEWIEYSRTVAASPTAFYIGIIHSAESPGVAYISQPILVFGNSIGSNNHVPPQNEVIWLQERIPLESGSAITADTAKNLEAWASGKIGKGIKAVYFEKIGQNSAAGKYAQICDAATFKSRLVIFSQVANLPIANAGWVTADSSGDYYIDVEDGNWSQLYIYVYGIQP